jgi:hypothetical protein
MTKLLRTLLALTAVLAVVLTTGVPAVAHEGHDHGSGETGHSSSDGHTGGESSDMNSGAVTIRDYEAVWDEASSSERAAATELIERTRVDAARWDDVDAALADGFVARRDGIGAVHYANFANRRDDGVLDPAHPEALVYLQRPNGDPILLGVVYTVNGFQDRPTPAGELAAWHVHGVPECHHPDLEPGCGDVRGGMLHVWLYDGVVDPFADPMFASMGTPPEWRSKLLDLAGAARRV